MLRLLLLSGLLATAKAASTFFELYRNDQLCTSTDCLEAAYNIKRKMNFSADPCEDFNEFVCGTFIAEERIPDEKVSVSGMTFVGDDILDDARDILEEPVGVAGDSATERVAKELYRTCMAEKQREELGIGPMKAILEELGGFPSGDSAPEISWPQVFRALYTRYGFDTHRWIVSVDVAADEKDSSARVIRVDQPKFGFDREFLAMGKDNKEISAYRQYMLDVAKLFGQDPTEDVRKRIEKVLNLEMALAKAATPKEERRNQSKLYNPRLLGEMGLLPGGEGMSWMEYINFFFDGILPIPDISPIPDTETVINRDPRYFSALGDILTEAGDAAIRDYISWRVLQFSLSYLNGEAAAIRQRFNRAARGQLSDRPQWKKCAGLIGFQERHWDGLNLAAGSLYAKRVFSPEAKEAMEEMVAYEKKAFRDQIEETDWMDDETKAKAFEKLDKMTEVIAYPNEILDNAKMDEFHGEIIAKIDDVGGTGLLAKRLELSRFNAKVEFRRLREPVVVGDWRRILVALANAFYKNQENRMEFPGGFLRGVFYNFNWPAYLKFASIGAVIGHEISHGFDDQGRQYDGNGNVHQWWSEASNTEYTARAQCVVDQYSAFEATQVGLNLNGVTTQGENIADNVGFKIAYKAYELYVQDTGDQGAGLPGLPFTARQLFWIGRAHTNCAKYTDEKLKSQILTRPHSPWGFRSNGPLMNFDDFARDFHCAAGDTMNPVDKCRVW